MEFENADIASIQSQIANVYPPVSQYVNAGSNPMIDFGAIDAIDSS